jgi:hypothetical protein
LEAASYSPQIAIEGYLIQTLEEEVENTKGKFTDEQCDAKRRMLKDLQP